MLAGVFLSNEVVQVGDQRILGGDRMIGNSVANLRARCGPRSSPPCGDGVMISRAAVRSEATRPEYAPARSPSSPNGVACRTRANGLGMRGPEVGHGPLVSPRYER
jgi:hypothetical protein